jgi:hypothetical protein
MSALAHFADPSRTFPEVREVPIGDIGLLAYSITSSACSRNDPGIVRPSALAVVRLMTRSNLALEPAANDYITCRVNSVDLKNRLGDVETDCRDRFHVWLLQIVGALTAPTSMALPCRWRNRPQEHTIVVARIPGSLQRLGQLGHLPSMLDRLSRSFTVREQGKHLGVLHRYWF